MIDQLTAICNERYQRTHCNNCSYGLNCPHNCAKCLEFIHFPDNAPAPRKYDCKRMVDYYVCKYAHKYTSELIYAFSQLRDLKEKPVLRVLSIGCGPCTDLLALSHLKECNDYRFVDLDYRGVEINPDVWSNIYTDISRMLPHNWSFEIIPEDICIYANTLIRDTWKPDLIVLQYVFSDMQKHTTPQIIANLLNTLATYIDSCNANTYTVCNDINLTTDRKGGREHFDNLFNIIQSPASPHRFHFKNSNKSWWYPYGDEYETNSLIVMPNNSLNFYAPYMSCASAQLIIKREFQ